MAGKSLILWHYTDSVGVVGFFNALALMASDFASGVQDEGAVLDPFSGAGLHIAEAFRVSRRGIGRDARGGDGLYLTDVPPGSATPGVLARKLFGVPWEAKRKRVSHWFALEVPEGAARALDDGVWIVAEGDRRRLRLVGCGRNPAFPFGKYLPSRGRPLAPIWGSRELTVFLPAAERWSLIPLPAPRPRLVWSGPGPELPFPEPAARSVDVLIFDPPYSGLARPRRPRRDTPLPLIKAG